LIDDREPCRTPFPVEYGRKSAKWGGGPTLTIDSRGGPVEGERLILAAGLGLGEVIDVLTRREGIPSADGIIQIENRSMTELACALPLNLADEDLSPGRLAARAVSSVTTGPQNGVTYLRGAMEVGIRTPRTERYAEEILRAVGCETLAEAERPLASPD